MNTPRSPFHRLNIDTFARHAQQAGHLMKNHIAIMLVIAGLLNMSPSCAQNQRPDSLLRVLSRHRGHDSVRVNLYLKLSHYYFGVDQTESSAYARDAIMLAAKRGYAYGEARAHNQLALIHSLANEAELAIACALRAESIAERNGFRALTGESYRVMGLTYLDQEDFAKAGNFYRKAEMRAREMGNKVLLAKTLNGEGGMRIRQKDRPGALKYYLESLKIAREIGMSFYMALILSNIGEIYLSGDPADLDNASQYFTQALESARISGNKNGETNALANLGKVYMLQGKLAESETLLLQSLKMSDQMGIRITSQRTYMKLVDLSLRQYNYKKASEYIQKYYAVRNYLMNDERTKEMARLEEKYQSEKREQQIQLLKQEKRFETASKNFWIIGSAFLLLAATAIYLLQQSRNKKARQVMTIQKTLIAEMEEMDLMKSRFFANISHEFRTPLSLIAAPLEELTKEVGSSGQINLNLIKRNANRLLELVNQLLDLSKFEAGKMEIIVSMGELGQWLRVFIASFESLAEARKINFQTTIDVPEGMFAFDQDKLEKILTNLLGNAFKFTSSGDTVQLSVQVTNDEGDLEVVVSDTGSGIPEKDLPHIFSPFFQSQHITSDGQPGTGLGLALVNEIVKLYRGLLHVQSREHEGTTLTVQLPLEVGKLTFARFASEPIPPILAASQMHDEAVLRDEIMGPVTTEATILVVEDNRELREFIARAFPNRYKVLTAENGEIGLQVATEQVPDVIISDVMMPGIDGIQLTECVRQQEVTCHIPVLLLTARSDGESRMRGLLTGADDYLSKPFSTDELRVRVLNMISQRKRLAQKFQKELVTPSPADTIPSIDDKFLIRLRETVSEHLADPVFGVEQLAAEMCLSRTQLFRKVKALLDTTPVDLINDIRLQRAAVLIRSRADTLTQISYSVGFREQSYFAKKFRVKFGVSPREYANS
ncbi:hybrid sensor histidine kinase/response regulator transcription factor [Dyadobacter endophyticus]|nr:ATP-binding protein [Dyadobacter endophyticus]